MRRVGNHSMFVRPSEWSPSGGSWTSERGRTRGVIGQADGSAPSRAYGGPTGGRPTRPGGGAGWVGGGAQPAAVRERADEVRVAVAPHGPRQAGRVPDPWLVG